MFTPDNSALVLIDIQGKLAESMHKREALYDNLVRLTRGALLLGLPILWLEQNPAKLGPTIAPLAELLGGHSPIPKMAFSACGEPRFSEALAKSDRSQLIVAGIECHICVYQTAADLLEGDYAVQVVADAVSSRAPGNHELGLQRLRSLGAQISSTEMVLFELLRSAEHPSFREVSRLVR